MDMRVSRWDMLVEILLSDVGKIELIIQQTTDTIIIRQIITLVLDMQEAMECGAVADLQVVAGGILDFQEVFLPLIMRVVVLVVAMVVAVHHISDLESKDSCFQVMIR